MSGRRQFNSSHDSGIGEHDIADPPVVIGAGALFLNGGAEAPGNIDNGHDAPGNVDNGGAEAPGNVNNGDDAPGNVNNGDDDDGVNETEETEYELQKEDLYDIIGTLKEKVKEHVNARVQILVQNRELQEEVKRFTDMTTSVSGAKEYKDAMKKRKAYEDILKGDSTFSLFSYDIWIG